MGRRLFGGTVAIGAREAALALFVAGELDDGRLAELLGAYLVLDWQSCVDVDSKSLHKRRVPTALALLSPAFHRSPPHDKGGRPTDYSARPDWPALLAVGTSQSVHRCIEDALRRVRIAGATATVRDVGALAAGVSCRRLAAACLVPLRPTDADRLFKRVIAESEADTSTTTITDPSEDQI